MEKETQKETKEMKKRRDTCIVQRSACLWMQRLRHPTRFIQRECSNTTALESRTKFQDASPFSRRGRVKIMQNCCRLAQKPRIHCQPVHCARHGHIFPEVISMKSPVPLYLKQHPDIEHVAANYEGSGPMLQDVVMAGSLVHFNTLLHVMWDGERENIECLLVSPWKLTVSA